MAQGKLTVVTNASPVIFLARMDCLDMLTRIYDHVYCSKAAAGDILYPQEAADFIRDAVEVREVKEAENLAIIEEISRKHPRLNRGELETHALGLELGVDETLFLNNQAENVLNLEYGGNARDLIELPDADVTKEVFKTEQDKDRFYLGLDVVCQGYKRLQALLRERGLK